jgi:transaldolase
LYLHHVSIDVMQATVNVGVILSKRVSGKVSNDIDARLAHNTQAIIDKVK